MAIELAMEEDEYKKRKYSVHPLNMERKRKRQFHLLHDELRKYPEKFFLLSDSTETTKLNWWYWVRLSFSKMIRFVTIFVN